MMTIIAAVVSTVIQRPFYGDIRSRKNLDFRMPIEIRPTGLYPGSNFYWTTAITPRRFGIVSRQR